MKKRILLLSFIFLFFFNQYALAHPGNTDSSGGHTCRTNCGYWGYNYGEYHYHNGGGSSPSYNHESEYNKGYDAGYQKGVKYGYRKDFSSVQYYYSTESYRDGWQIGFDKGWADGYAKKEQEERNVQEVKAGEVIGNQDGEKAFKNGYSKDKYEDLSSRNEYFIKGYKSGFATGWETGKNKKAAYDRGYALGLKQDKITGHSGYKEPFLSSYEDGFDDGVDERDQINIEILKQQGDKLGYEGNKLTLPKTNKKIYEEAFIIGYEDGSRKREKEIKTEGFMEAFKSMEYQEPSNYKGNELFKTWFKSGYLGNKIAIKIKETAYKNGLESDKYFIPEKYKVNQESISLYNSLFNNGQKVRNAKIEKLENNIMIGSVVGIPLLIGGVLVYRKRRIKDK
jgi:hypothetical protein